MRTTISMAPGAAMAAWFALGMGVFPQSANAESSAAVSVASVVAELGTIPRPEHPRPDRCRPDWLNLNGVWEFALDPQDKGTSEAWHSGGALGATIVVPFCPESQLSGIGDEDFHPLCWYARQFDLPENLSGKRVLLHFGAVDYRCDVWVNGQHLGQHVGGYDSFDFDVTAYLKRSDNRLVLRVQDDPRDPKPRGKQSGDRHPSGCTYMRVTGIWQTVWLEAVGGTFVRDWTIAGDPDSGVVHIEAVTDGPGEHLSVSATASLDGRAVAQQTVFVTNSNAKFSLVIPNPKAWSPDTPTLYDLEFKLLDAHGMQVDVVRSYFGLRRISIENGALRLNGKPFFLISALDQGYYPRGLYTPPTDEALREDVQWAKRYGLNSVRKHQIIAEPRFHYWCDRLGLTIWEEMPDWGWQPDDFDGFLRQWSACVRRDFNHPCVITWVPTNERCSPDTEQVNSVKARLYEATKEMDPTRPVIDTSGYCHTKTDIADLHVNPPDGKACREWWNQWRRSIAQTANFPAWPDRPTFCKGYHYQGQPVVISETGNWWISEMPPAGPWKPYGAGPVSTVKAFVDLYRDVFLALMAEPDCAGFSYVQLYDVEGEGNGYLTYDRKPKASPDTISAIHAEGLRLRN